MQNRQDIIEELQEKLAEVELTPLLLEALTDLWEVANLLITQQGAYKTRRLILASDVLDPALKDALLDLHEELRAQ